MHMETTTLIMLGHPVDVRYAFHDGNYVEWYLQPCEHNTQEVKLLETLLRLNHSDFIESKIRELHFFRSYAEHAGQIGAEYSDVNMPF